MSTKMKLRGGLIASILLALGFSPGVFAADNAGTSITNDVTVNWDSGGEGQTDTASETFVIDLRVQFDVATTDGAPVGILESVTSSGSDVVTFTITNNSNDELTFDLSAANSAIARANLDFDPGAADAGIDASGFNIYEDGVGGGTVDGTINGESTTTSVTIAADGGVATILVGANTSPAGTAGDFFYVELIATAVGANSTVDDLQTVGHTGTTTELFEVFFDEEDADTDDSNGTSNDGIEAAASVFEITVIVIEPTKSSSVISDPLGAATYQLSGSVIEYSIALVQTDGAGSATNVVFIDDYDDTNTTIVQDVYNASTDEVSVTFDGAGTDFTCTLDAATAADGTGSDLDECWIFSTDIYVNIGTITDDETATITYRVTIN